MTDFHFFHPIEVRYGDLDPQGHVNNAKYLTYLEQGRVAYLRRLGLWQGGSFLTLGMILAEVQVTFRLPILLGDLLQVGVAVTRLGNKSFTMTYHLEDTQDGRLFASASSVQVAYDYAARQTIPIPEDWRVTIRKFEGIDS